MQIFIKTWNEDDGGDKGEVNPPQSKQRKIKKED